jgi:tetratricopeptide (TPR) repeat protein
LGEAVAAYRKALEVYTREELPQNWAGTQNNLGNLLQEQGIRTGGAEGTKLLGEAVAAYRKALEVYTREELPQGWTGTQNNLGNALREQGIRTGGAEGTRLLGEAVAAFRKALDVRTVDHFPLQWAQNQNNLADTYWFLKDWPNAAECYTNVLKVYPNYERAFQRSSYLYMEELFNFAAAYELNEFWSKNNPNDLFAQVGLSEKQFTTGRFTESERNASQLLGNSLVDSKEKILLRTIKIANLVALGKIEQIPGELDNLRAVISSQSEDFKIGRSFNGTKHFITENMAFSPHREWLLALIEAIQAPNRDAILIGLNPILKNFRQRTK